MHFGLDLPTDHTTLLRSNATSILGSIALDMARPAAALKAYDEALKIQQALVPQDDPSIASIMDSVANAYIELGEVVKPHGCLDQALAIHVSHAPSRSTRTQFISAMAHLRGNDAEKAARALAECWRLQDKKNDQIEQSRYPKHSGDIVLLARIQYLSGEKGKALELMSRTVSTRKDVFGRNGPRVADSMVHVAEMMKESGKEAPAAKIYREIIEMSQGMPEMKGQLARA